MAQRRLLKVQKVKLVDSKMQEDGSIFVNPAYVIYVETGFEGGVAKMHIDMGQNGIKTICLTKEEALRYLLDDKVDSPA